MSLARKGMHELSESELAIALRNTNQKLRLYAQYELVRRKNSKVFEKLLENEELDVAKRLHGIWGLGALTWTKPSLAEKLSPYLKDESGPIRKQVLKVFGDLPGLDEAFKKPILNCLNDRDHQVVMQALMCAAKRDYKEATKIIKKLTVKHVNDAFWRHALVFSAARLFSQKDLVQAVSASQKIQLLSLLALRRKQSAKVKQFLNSKDELIFNEALRAVSELDLSLETKEIELLISQINNRDLRDIQQFRALNILFRSGTDEAMVALLSLSQSGEKRVKLSALEFLAQWQSPNPINAVTGFYSPLSPRSAEKLIQQLGPIVEQNLSSTNSELVLRAFELLDTYKLEVSAKVLKNLLLNQKLKTSLRKRAGAYLADTAPVVYNESLKGIILCKQDDYKIQALVEMNKIAPEKTKDLLVKLMIEASEKELKTLLPLLADFELKAVEGFFLKELELYRGGQVKTYSLELLEAALKSPFESVRDLAQGSIESTDETLKNAYALRGGDPKKGRKIFFEHAAAQCQRCHKINLQGGDAGPDLSDVGLKYDKTYLLNALINPSRDIAPGYGMATVTFADGRSNTGVLKSETKQALILQEGNGDESTFQRAELKDVQVFPSGMPPMKYLLKRDEIRDLTEFLSFRKKRQGGH